MNQQGRSIAAVLEEGLGHHQAGRLPEAEASYRQILAVDPAHADSLHLLGVMAQQLGQNMVAVEYIRKAIAARPSVAPYHFNLGNALRDAGRREEAEASFRAAVRVQPDYIQAHNNLGSLLRDFGRVQEAETCYRTALRFAPDSPELHNNLGNMLRDLGRAEDAAIHCRKAIELKPDFAEAHNNLGAIFKGTGRVTEAEACYRAAIRFKSDFAEAYGNLGTILHERGSFEEAEASHRAALRIWPDYPDAHNNLGNVLKEYGRSREAEACYREAIRLKPDFAVAHYNLGTVLQELGRFDEAEICCRDALRVNPKFAEAYSNLGSALRALGRLKEAEVSCRSAVDLEPDLVEAHSNLIFTLDLVPGLDISVLREERRRWYDQHGKKLTEGAPPHKNAPDPERKLKVGYVSADFRRHSAAVAFGPVLRHHDHARFELFCYSNLPSRDEDEITQGLRGAADQWREIVGMSDEAVAEQIREDGIDILVDCSGHTNGNRLLVFARKPAPIQVAGWGHTEGTLMPAMDYLLGDPVVVPQETRKLFYEKVIDLPCWVVYEAPRYAPEVANLPAAGGLPITFGCLNRVSKLSEGALDVWGRILAVIPNARILIKDVLLDEASVRARIEGALVKRGVDAGRIILLGRTGHPEQLATFGRIDIALDPFPDSGGISTMEALWMGVPVVTVLGKTGPSRGTAAILSALGLNDWIAKDADDYVRIASSRAEDIDGLARMRSALRGRVSGSVIGDATRYTRIVEDIYRDAWRDWCQQSPRST